MSRAVVVALIALFASAGCRRAVAPVPLSPATFAATPWPDLVASARGSEVRYAMWTGDEARTRFYQGDVVRGLRQDLGIELRIVPLADTADLINKLLNEKAAGSTSTGSVDLVWINGENFRTAKQAGVLWGPFADRLPNIRYFDVEARQRDFGTATDGYEAPWQQAQFVFAYDSARVDGAAGNAGRVARLDSRASRPLHLSGAAGLHRLGVRASRVAAQRRPPRRVRSRFRRGALRARVEDRDRLPPLDQAVSCGAREKPIRRRRPNWTGCS